MRDSRVLELASDGVGAFQTIIVITMLRIEVRQIIGDDNRARPLFQESFIFFDRCAIIA